MFVRIQVIFLNVIQKTARDCSYPLNVHLRAREILPRVLNSILKILQRKNQLEKRFRVKHEAGSIVSALGYIVRLVENDDGIVVTESVIGPHRLVQHVVVAHKDQISFCRSLFVHVERAYFVIYANFVQIFDIIRLLFHQVCSLGIFIEKFTLPLPYRTIAPILQVVALNVGLTPTEILP